MVGQLKDFTFVLTCPFAYSILSLSSLMFHFTQLDYSPRAKAQINIDGSSIMPLSCLGTGSGGVVLVG